MLTLLWPWMLLLLPLPWLVRRLLPRRNATGSALQLPGESSLAARLGGIGTIQTAASRWILPLLMAVGWALLVLAAARPTWLGEPVELPATGRDLMLAVDISGSMDQDDMIIENRRVTRITAVKAVVSEFLERRAGDRVGLILFGTRPFLQAPLSFDRATVGRLLREAPVGIAGGKTAIGDAIGLATKRLRERPDEQRVLILLTDGASNEGELAPARAAAIAAESGIRIHTIGIGSTQSPPASGISGMFSRLLMRPGNPSADLDEDTLQKIAITTGGRFFRARDPQELVEIYAEIDALEPIEQSGQFARPRVALHAPLVAAVFLLSLLVTILKWREHSVVQPLVALQGEAGA